MDSNIQRKEVWLYPASVERLKFLAEKRGWSVKQYMENVLVKESLKAIEKGYADTMAPMLGDAINSNKKKK